MDNNLLPQDPSVLFVCLLGVGVVFVGLACIIALVELMNFICSKFAKQKAVCADVKGAIPTAQNTVIENREEIIAAVCAAVAEENGTDISAIRVLSFKKI